VPVTSPTTSTASSSIADPILDYWCESGEDLPHIVRHVLIHEIGHHFGLSDDDMEAIEAKAEEESQRVQPNA